MSRPSQRSVELHVRGACELACPVCRCREQPSAASTHALLDMGGERVTLSGGTGSVEALLPLVRRARNGGYREVVVRTTGLTYADPDAAAALGRAGVDGVIVPLLSQVSKVHDRVAGRDDALVGALVGMRAAALAGMFVELEIPLLPPSLQRPSAVVELARRAVPGLRAAWFRLPTRPVPAAIAPAPWSVGAPLLAEALDACTAAGIKIALRPEDAIPFCALRDFVQHHRAFKFNPKSRRDPPAGARHVRACESCAARGQCPGVADAYSAVNGERDITPFSRRLESLYDQRTTPRRLWTDEQRAAAANRKLLVLRPTVNCNQDCAFCSANETSNNVWSDPGEMLRAIARAGRQGVKRLDFSGGEPTLSRHLPSLIQAARRCGIGAVELVTNGVLIDSPERVSELVDAGLTHAFVSLHAHDEMLSRTLTQKIGDFERTTRTIGLLADAGVETALNHVITTANYRFVSRFVEFVHARYGGRVYISFAFVTPQYKALENLDLVPRMSEVMPDLKLAMLRCLELGQPFGVGSRQGIPPCQLGAFQAWSDILGLMDEAQAEDAPQKQRIPACDRCRYSAACTGLWRPYVARYGTDELTPVAGALPALDEHGHVAGMKVSHWRVPMRFEDVPDALRDRADEAALQELARARATPLPAIVGTAPLRRSRPLRVLLAGTGRQARRIAREARDVEGFGLDAVVSPHAPDGDLGDFGGCPAYRDVEEALDGIRPEAVLVAAATHVHRAIAEAALARRIPVLIEKPLTHHLPDAEALCARAVESATLLVPAHNVLYATGLDRMLQPGRWSHVSYRRRCPEHLPDAPRTWGRPGLYQTLYHVLVLTGRAAGGGVPDIVDVQHQGASRPERIRVTLAYGTIRVDARLDFAAAEDDVSIAVARSADAAPELTWTRSGASVVLEDRGHTEVLRGGGSEIARMLASFRDAVLGKCEAGARADEALDVMRACDRVLDALEGAGAPLKRAGAPKHVASPSLR